ncbi:MAG: cytochrome C oxidase subunit IV family protein [Planctomycetes bacterium]|nr:cytochrome C oxidase subunit IV family protein [Planctomycetota bacterium]
MSQHEHGSGQAHGGHHVHVVPLSLYFGIITVLFVLTAATVITAKMDLGAYNTVVALVIAITKATLVVLYFMHVRWSKKLVWIMVGSSLVWFSILIAFTMQDYLSRGWG